VAEKVATYALNLESNTAKVSKEASAALEGFRAKIADSTTFVKQMQESLRNLRGSSDEVTAAKKSLKAQIEAERATIAQANLAILAQGKTYGVLAKAAKEATGQQAKMSAPVKELHDKFAALGEAVGTTTGLMGLAVLGGAALTAGLVDLGAKAAGAALDLAKFGIVGGDAARSMALQREAVSGSAENAKNWGDQIDATRRKVSLTTEKLNEMSLAISRSLSGGQSRASGEVIVDTFNAAAEAADALGDDAGKAIEDIIAEGKRFGRIGLDPTMLQGKWNTGWEDIAASVAKNLNVSVATAKQALITHRITIDAGAKAIRDAVDKRFGEIDQKKLLSLDSLSKTLHDDWVALTKGVDLEPILGGLKKVVDLFDVTKVEGYELRELFKTFGKQLGGGVDDGVSLATEAVDQFILALLDLDIWIEKNKGSWKKTWDDTGGIDAWKAKIGELITDVKDLAAAAADVAKVITGTAKAVGWVSDKLGKGVGSVVFAVEDHLENVDAQQRAYDAKLDAKSTGSDVAAGMAAGAKGGSPAVADAMVTMAKEGIEAARGPAGADAHSPSRKTEQLGEDLAAGIPRGVSRGQGDVDQSMADMVQAPRVRAMAGASGGAGSGAPIIVNLTFQLPPGVDGAKAQEAVRVLSAPSSLAMLTKAVEQALRITGVPTQQAATA